MNSTESTEHFVTLFDSNFIAQGICLHQSLRRYAPNGHLWIICVDDEVRKQLELLALPHTSLIPLQEIETDALRAVKPGRTRAEYCWTLTPFSPAAVFNRAPAAKRVTYLDADLFFFDSPHLLLDELDRSEKDVLITEHAYDPRYDQTDSVGRFCVQFMPFRNTPKAGQVMLWWQERCVEWCFARAEPGRCGDQKYLDLWPTLFPESVHILSRPELTLAPWNVDMFLGRHGANLRPVFYHFQGLRLVRSDLVRLHAGFRLGRRSRALYREYMDALRQALELLRRHGIAVPVLPEPRERLQWLRRAKRVLFGDVRYERIAALEQH